MTKHKRILIYIEGEGGGNPRIRSTMDSQFRQCWKKFLQPLAEMAKELGVVFFQCIPGGGGQATLDDFANPLPNDAGALRILLIDSEGPVENIARPWEALQKTPPDWASNHHCYLIVQCLETWLLADVQGLKRYYNKNKGCFNENKIRSWPNLESVPKATVQNAIEEATANCKPPYGHADGNRIICELDRDALRTLPSVRRLFDNLAVLIRQYAEG